jgi:hypothetical protein
MIKYCFCFFLCVLTLNGADDNEKDLKKAVITRQPNSSCHPFFYLEYFQLPKNPRITIVYDTSTTQPIFFDSPFKHAKYLHGKGAYPSLKMSPYSKIVENLANLSAPILKLLSFGTPESTGNFRLDPGSESDWGIMHLALTLSLHSITTPLNTSMHTWKINTLLKAFDELWGGLCMKENTIERNQMLRKALTMVVDPCNVFEFEKHFQKACPALAAWANSNNTSGKPAGAVITILLVFACSQWHAPPPVPTLILPSSIRSSVSLTNIASITNDGCMMSPRRAALLKKGQGSQHTTSPDGPLSAKFSNADRRARLFDAMHNNRASSMPRSPSGDTPSPFSSTFSLLPTIDAAGTDAFYDAFYIGDNDDSDDGTV